MRVTEGSFDHCLRQILNCDFIAVDTETTGLRPFQGDKLFSVIVAIPTRTYYFNYNQELDHLGASPVDLLPHETLSALAQIFTSSERTVCFANAKFDLHMLGFTDIKSKIHDVLVVDRLLYNDTPATPNLSRVAKRYGYEKSNAVDEYIKQHGLWKWVAIPGKKSRAKEKYFAKVPINVIQPYAENDARITLKIAANQLLDLKKLPYKNPKKVKIPPEEVEAKLVHVLWRMEREGVLIDKNYVEEKIEEHSTAYRKVARWLHDKMGKPFIDSAECLSPVFQAQGYTPPKTAKGSDSFNEDWLSKIDHPLAKAVLEHRHHHKLANTYYRSFLWFADETQRIHASANQAGARTGRFSYSEPNLQNVPEEVRRAFIPDPGFCFVSIDYQQQEYRLMLDYAKEMKIIEAVNNGLDIHTATAEMMGIERTPAKTLNFCIAAGSKVLTDQGLRPIEDVTAEMKVWDGVEWVNHGGVIYQGYREVLEYEGLTATPEHKVFTRQGRKICIGDLAKESGNDSIAVTEIDGIPLRYSPITSKNTRPKKKTSNYFGGVSGLRKTILNFCFQYLKKENNQLSLPEESKVRGARGYSSAEAAGEVPGRKGPVLQPELPELQKLRGAWDRGALHLSRILGGYYRKVFQGGHTVDGCGSHRQQRALRGGELKSCFQVTKPSKSKAHVYDIINAGPRHRFTVNGKLVSNCLLYGGGTVKMAGMLFPVTTGEEELWCIWKEAKGWKMEPEEVERNKSIPPALREENLPHLLAAEKLRNLYFERLPNIQNFIERVKNQARTKGFTHSWDGRILRCTNQQFAYKMPNTIIQGGGASIAKRAMIELDSFLLPLKSKMLLQIHDELLFKVHESELGIVPELQRTMETVYPYKYLPLTTSVSHSWENWFDLKDGFPSEETRNKVQREGSSGLKENSTNMVFQDS